MIDVNPSKRRFIRDLWLPTVKKSTKYLSPRKRKCYEMSLFTLTADDNFEEVNCFSGQSLILESKTVAWSFASTKRWRLGTELTESTIVGLAKYENSNIEEDIKDFFPFDIINLDFSSQIDPADPFDDGERIDKEVNSLERTISIQKGKNADFVLIYTTILNGNDLNFNNICTNSDSIRCDSWTTLNDGSQTIVPIRDNKNKIDALKFIFKRLAEKYQFHCDSSIKAIKINDNKIAISIAGLFRRSNT